MRLDSYTKTNLMKNAQRFFLRMQHTNPFPAIVNDVVPGIDDPAYNTYMSCMPEHIRNAILLLMANTEYQNILDEHSKSSLTISIHPFDEPDPTKSADISIFFWFSRLYPSWPHHNTKASLDLKHPMYAEIVEWVHRSIKIKEDYKRCCWFINSIVDWANTAGQLYTMFPDYVRLLPDHQQEHISNMQRQSRLPKEADMVYLDRNRQFVAEKVALCLLLPKGGERIWVK